MHTRRKPAIFVLPLLLALAMLFPSPARAASVSIPEFSGAAAIECGGNRPDFEPPESVTGDYITYLDLDTLGRAGQVMACLSRASLSALPESGDVVFQPSGWKIARYDDLIDGSYLYTRCCLVPPALGGDPADARNVLTGTRYFYTEGMQVYADLVADYVRRTANHVLYRVTPLYIGDDLVATGVQMEAYSVEDSGRSLCFNVFLYNIQPGVRIDYRDGESQPDAELQVSETAKELIGGHLLSLETSTEAPAVSSFAELFSKEQNAASKDSR